MSALVEEKKGTDAFEEVATFREDALVCTVTKRLREGETRFSYTIFKEYDMRGDTRRTNWFDKRHLMAIHKLLDQLEAWLEAEEDKIRSQRRVVAAARR